MKTSTIFHIAIALGFILGTAGLTAANAEPSRYFSHNTEEQEMPDNTFIDLLDELDAGIYRAKLEEISKAVAHAVRTHKKPGNVSLVFKIEPQKGSEAQVNLSHQIKYSQPTDGGKLMEENQTETLVYVGNKGNMSILPENQMSFLDKKTGEVSNAS